MLKHKSDIHTVVFKTNEASWNTTLAREWLKIHNLTPIKRVRIENNQLRYRIKDPALFKSFITKKIKKDGINLVIGYY